MSKSRINVEVLEERTVIVMSRLQDVINIFLEISVNVFYVLIDKIVNIKKESTLKKSIFEKLEYF